MTTSQDDIPSADDAGAATSNRLPILAEEIRRAHAEVHKAVKTAAERAIEAGHALIEAKELVKYGEWLPILNRAGIPERTARNYMTLARSGLKSATVADLGGIRAALAYLSEPRRPRRDEAMILEGTDCFGVVFEATEYPGFYHVCVYHDIEGADGEWRTHEARTKRTVWPERIEVDGRSVNLLWHFVDVALGGKRSVSREYIQRDEAAFFIARVEREAALMARALDYSRASARDRMGREAGKEKPAGGNRRAEIKAANWRREYAGKNA